MTQWTIANSPTRIPLVLRYHRAIRSVSSTFQKQIHIKFSHSPNLALLCLNIYLSLPSKCTNKPEIRDLWTLEPELSINAMVVYPIFSQNRRVQALQEAILRMLMGVPNSQLTTNFSANSQLTTNFG